MSVASLGGAQRRRILRAATECVAIYGADAVRLRDIAKHAGVSVGTLQHYFVVRQALVEEAFDWSSSQLCDYWSQVVGAHRDPWDRIESLMADFTNHPRLRSHCKTWIELCAAGGRHPELRPAIDRISKWWRTMLGEAVREGVESDLFHPALSEEEVVDVLVATVDGCELAFATETPSFTADRIRDTTLRLAADVLRYDTSRRGQNDA